MSKKLAVPTVYKKYSIVFRRTKNKFKNLSIQYF
jgi:hypothetical protein